MRAYLAFAGLAAVLTAAPLHAQTVERWRLRAYSLETGGEAHLGEMRGSRGAADSGRDRSAERDAGQAEAFTFTAAIFLPGTARLTADAAARLRDLGRTLRDTGVPSVDIRVVEEPGVDRRGVPLATSRAAAVAAGIVRGGYPRTRLVLSVVRAPAGVPPGTVSLRPAPGDGAPLSAPTEPLSRLR
ncbi:MAG TPA: hypothetical protein VFQ38_17570 [Longimicrobiales bacterium]|nr:hypothetical protein [Longimicrobiales bacterium]